MTSANQQTTNEVDRRDSNRTPLDGTVTLAFERQDIVGPGENVSDDGVFFVAATSLRVRVKLPGETGWRDGDVVRVQSMGEGQLGFAVRF